MDIHYDPSNEAQCWCGALLDQDDASLCRKCTARNRYRRRHAGRRGHRNPDARRDGDLG